VPKFTPEQNRAINEEGNNIIVSAGAGSGKTAVLSERVLRKLKDGVSISSLLVLTFTNEAAKEMKNRIRKKIEKEPDLSEQLDYIDSAYITTFDSYALSLVKKYHYLLNISSEVNIIDSNVIECLKEEMLDGIFESLYKDKDEKFLKLIDDFCVRDDKNIREAIKSISNSLDLKYDKEEYLNSYLDYYYNDKYLDQLISDYEHIINQKIRYIENLVSKLEDYVTGEYYCKVYECLENLFSSKTYDDYKVSSLVSLPRAYKDMDIEAKEIKENISSALKEVVKLCEYDSRNYIKEVLVSTKTYVEAIINIIKELDKKVNGYKFQHDNYEFVDINKMAIKIVDEYKEVRDELKKFYNEIMVDEYQDTNDLQEMFISFIENNNVYMVGDVKQSIYRFRNANPDIFRVKYNNYSDLNGGIKIDLLKNFRSRFEVLDNINLIFNQIMDDALGGAEYTKSHQMVFGNTSYNEEGYTNDDHNLEILTYDVDKFYSKEELEAFIIASDIKEKVNSKYLVYDKDENVLRPIKYSDICIIMDRGSAFLKYKEIFTYMQIPISIYADFKLTQEYDILAIKSLINLIVKINKKEFDKDFNYYYVSVLRSFIDKTLDDEIYKSLEDKTYFETNFYKKCLSISRELNCISNSLFLEKIIDNFNIYEKLVTIGDIDKSLIRINHLKDIAKSLEMLGYTPIKFCEYLNKIIDNDMDIKYSIGNSDLDNVKIMNIHKSKGLEFNICYFSGLYKSFNISDLKEKFSYDFLYGIITPFYNNGMGNTILKVLQKDRYMKEEIAERIRLFYVALTRAKEKMIMVMPDSDIEFEHDSGLVGIDIRLGYRSFLDMIYSIKLSLQKYVKKVDISCVNLTKNYKNHNISNLNDKLSVYCNKTKKVNILENRMDINEISKKHASKVTHELFDLETKAKMKFGTMIHELLERVDFYNPVVSSKYQKYIDKFLNQIDLNDVKIYKEYEFVFSENDTFYHGIIDLLLEYEDKFVIIDYKLKNVLDENYVNQVNVYKNYLKQISQKEVFAYLYSIIDGSLNEVGRK